MEDKTTQLIMIVDDDSTIIKLVKGMLRRKGWCAFITTSQPETAIEYLSDGSNALPVLIITDNEMGKVCGEDIIKLAQTKNIPTVLMSGNAHTGLPVAQKYNIGFIDKPWSVQKFYQTIDNALTSQTS